jgi:CheY-like chemotaxis protein
LDHGPSERGSANDPPVPVALIVEDEWLLRDSMAEELQEAGWRVLEASTAEAALTLLQDGHPIDIVVTDIQLAGQLTGWDVAEGFRAVHPDMPILYVSGNPIDALRRVSASIFLSKPHRSAAISDACRQLIESRNDRPESIMRDRSA